MGESVAEATVIKWTKNPGDYVEADETVMEIATDKVDSDVPSPVAGTLLERLCNDNDVVQVGAAIAVIETAEPELLPEGNPADQPAGDDQPPADEPVPPAIPEHETATDDLKTNAGLQYPVDGELSPENIHTVPYVEQTEHRDVPNAVEMPKSGVRFYSPLVRNIAAREGISAMELDAIPGSGAEGRLTKDDLLSYIQHRPQPGAGEDNADIPQKGSAAEKEQPKVVTEQPQRGPEPVPVSGAEPIKPSAGQGSTIPISGISLSPGDEIIEMDRMRRLISDHMVMSKQTSAHVTSFVEADVTNLVLWRDKIKSAFEKREGEKITFTPIFIESVVRAIKDMPMINISVNGTQIIKKKDINIGMAAALPNGNLIVPVIKNADELSLVGLTKAVNDLANRSRSNKLKPDEIKEGTFTLTNVGSFGNVMGTPIINQPQVAILAVGAIRKKPAVIETLQGDVIGIRHMMFLSLSYDHRVVDGALGGSFVRRVADYLENWDPGREI